MRQALIWLLRTPRPGRRWCAFAHTDGQEAASSSDKQEGRKTCRLIRSDKAQAVVNQACMSPTRVARSTESKAELSGCA